MSCIREDVIHLAVRRYLKNHRWILVAGQYPNGTDDELPILNIKDPDLAKDNSPDHRRHSMNKLVPDLVALKDSVILIVEMKPTYCKKDEEKLLELLKTRKHDFTCTLEECLRLNGKCNDVNINNLVYIPCMGFGSGCKYKHLPDFCYFEVISIEEVVFCGNNIIKEI